MEYNFAFLSFHELKAHELYELLKLRSDIFVVEQNCVYSDMDNKDFDSYHCLVTVNSQHTSPQLSPLVGYARILPSGLADNVPSIGRVLVHPDFRGRKLAYILMEKCIEFTLEKFSTKKISISAQSHLSEFYGNLGFVKKGDEYLEDGIPHCKMYFVTQDKND